MGGDIYKTKFASDKENINEEGEVVMKEKQRERREGERELEGVRTRRNEESKIKFFITAKLFTVEKAI